METKSKTPITADVATILKKKFETLSYGELKRLAAHFQIGFIGKTASWMKTEVKKKLDNQQEDKTTTKVKDEKKVVTKVDKKSAADKKEKSENKTAIILKELQAGVTDKEIIKKLGYSKSTVAQVKCLLKKYGVVFKMLKTGSTNAEIIKATEFKEEKIIYCKRFVKHII